MRALSLPSLLLVSVLLAPQAVHAQAESREGIYLQNQILQLRQELEALRRGGSALGGPSYAPPPRGGVAAPQGELLGQMLDRVSALEEELRRLRGRLEETEHVNRQLAANLEKLQGDMDYRLGQLEGNAPAARSGAPAAPSPARPVAPAAPVPPVAAPPGPPAATAPRPPERAIADGRAALARRDFAAAEAAAREVLGNRAAAARAVDAQILLGDALAAKRDFSGAALAYNEAFTRSRTGPRAPEALLGLASSFTSLGNRREACDTLDDLRSNFPNLRGAVAERAAEARRRAGCR